MLVFADADSVRPAHIVEFFAPARRRPARRRLGRLAPPRRAACGPPRHHPLRPLHLPRARRRRPPVPGGELTARAAGIAECAYDDLDTVRLTRGFFHSPERFLRAARCYIVCMGLRINVSLDRSTRTKLSVSTSGWSTRRAHSRSPCCPRLSMARIRTPRASLIFSMSCQARTNTGRDRAGTRAARASRSTTSPDASGESPSRRRHAGRGESDRRARLPPSAPARVQNSLRILERFFSARVARSAAGGRARGSSSALGLG